MKTNFTFSIEVKGEGTHASHIIILDPTNEDGISILKSFMFLHDDNTKDEDIRGTIAEMIKEDYDDEFELFQGMEEYDILGHTNESGYLQVIKLGKINR